MFKFNKSEEESKGLAEFLSFLCYVYFLGKLLVEVTLNIESSKIWSSDGVCEWILMGDTQPSAGWMIYTFNGVYFYPPFVEPGFCERGLLGATVDLKEIDMNALWSASGLVCIVGILKVRIGYRRGAEIAIGTCSLVNGGEECE